MNNFSRIIIGIWMTAVFLFGVSDSSFGDQGGLSWNNPAYRGTGLFESDKRVKRSSESGAVCSSYREFKTVLTERLQARLNAFHITLTYDFAIDELESISDRAFSEIKAADGYLYWNIVRYESRWEGKDGSVDMDCSAEYLTTAGQEDYVREKSVEILSEIIGDDMNEDEKVRAIHDWIVLNTRYDTTGTGRSAYDVLTLGRAVCHGYTLIAFEMLREAGIESVIVEGVPAMNHIWNMAKICGNWYHLDVTYDDPVPDLPLNIRYDYFLKSDEEMMSASAPHTWESGCPLATVSYLEGACLSEEFTMIHGLVTDENGEAIEARLVSRLRKGGTTETFSDISGYYEFTGLGPGVYTVNVSKKGYKNGKVTVRISENGTYEQNFVLSPKKR